ATLTAAASPCLRNQNLGFIQRSQFRIRSFRTGCFCGGGADSRAMTVCDSSGTTACDAEVGSSEDFSVRATVGILSRSPLVSGSGRVVENGFSAEPNRGNRFLRRI